MDVLGKWPLSELEPLVSLAHKEGRSIVFVGTGTERLEREESRRLVERLIAPKVLHWSVRSERDRERLMEYGVPDGRITVAADLAWMLDREPAVFGRAYLASLGVDVDHVLMGVNINGEKFVLEREPGLFEKVAIFLDAIIEKFGAFVLFFCNEVREEESFDKAAQRKILRYMKHGDKAVPVPNLYWSPQEMLSLVGCCYATISTRYHFCLFSALQGVPFIALKRSGKVDDLCRDMNWKYGAALEGLSPSDLLVMFAEIREERELLAAELKSLSPEMRQKATKNKKPLQVLCGVQRQ